MNRRSIASLVLVLIAASTGPARPRAQSPARADQPYVAAATAILVDVVVRDRKGRPVTDLMAEDFELAEDGVAQKVATFTRVSRGGGIGVGVAWRSPGTTALTTSSEQPADDGVSGTADVPGTTALVFDHLSAESMRLAQRATLAYVPMSGDSETRIGVFATGPGIRVLQRYTTERSLVRRALTRLMPSATSAEEQQRERQDELIARRRELDQQAQVATATAANISGASLAAAGAEIGAQEYERRLVQTELNMMRSLDNLDRDHRGYDTSQALLGVIQSLAHLPGRKTIVFFSEGLPVSPGLSARLDAVIDTANRAHVTTYAIDAHGLRTHSASANVNKEMQAFVDERTSQLSSAADRTDQPLTMGFERVEDTFRLDSRTGLAKLAQDTGGFLVEESNDLSAAFRRIDEDNRFHYLLTYAPTNTTFDGRFRTIQVKVRRPGVQVFARKGYRAVRTPRMADAGSYEAPALALLDRTPLPRAFPIHAAAFSFPDPARPGLTPIVLQVATSALRFATDPARSTYSAQATVVVRIRDEAGREVEKLSQEYLLTGDSLDVEAAKRGDILFYREPALPPGVYTVESIVFDAVARHGSARVATLTVPAAGPALSMSSLVIVSRVEDTSEAADTNAPLYVGRTLVYPNLGEPIRKSATGELAFFFTLYGRTGTASASAQLLRNGQPIAEAPVTLASPRDGRLQHVGRISIETLPPGTYELRIRIADSGHELSRTAFFTLLQ